MEKRNWPWRRKTGTDRPTSPNESFESASIHSSSRHIDYQDISGSVPEYPHASDDGSKHWQDYEERIKVLNDKLSGALMEAAGKEILAKQHAKLAEEAVSGWETVEAEAAVMKHQLENAIQHKLAMEDRVSHLDGALKECMRQLRNVREEQEENIHNALAKKTREWDGVQCELQGKIVDLEQKLLAKDAESTVVSRSLTERARTISQISDACGNAQAEVGMLRVRLESSEKEKATLKYELSVAHKEIEIRNEEKGLSKRAADAASRQHLEDVKKIARLEAECQRLRALIRKKLPGPAAIAQMRLEAEALGIEKHDSRKKSGKGNVSPRDSMQELTMEENDQAKESCLWSDRFSSLEEETKMLREILAKRNNELQSARLMCARTASKLSAVEQQVESLNINQGKQKIHVVLGLEAHTERSIINSGEPSLSSISEDGNDGEVNCAESWATALIAELDQFKKEKLMPNTNTIELASKPDIRRSVEPEDCVATSIRDESMTKQQKVLDTKKEADEDAGLSVEEDGGSPNEVINQAACKLCKKFRMKLAAAEEDLAKMPADLTRFAELKRKITLLIEEGTGADELWQKINLEMEFPEVQSKGCSLPGDKAALADVQDGLNCFMGPSSVHRLVPELTTAVHKIVSLMKDLSTNNNTEDQLSASTTNLSTSDSKDTHNGSLSRKLDLDDVQCRSDDLEAKCHNLEVTGNRFISAEVDLPHFIMELLSVLSIISRMNFGQDNVINSPRKALSLKSTTTSAGETDFGLGSPFSDTSKSECSDAAARVVPANETLQSFSKDCFSSEVVKLEEELRKAQAERVALETQMKADYERFNDLEEELFQLKLVKGELEACLVKKKEEILQLKAEILEAEEKFGRVEAELSSAESSKRHGDQQLCNITTAKEKAESLLCACQSELEEMHIEMKSIRKELSNKKQKNSELNARCKELQEQLEMKSSWSCPKCSKDAVNDDHMCRELEIIAASEKLAKCEETILLLGQQLKALASPKGSAYQAIQKAPSLTQATFELPTSILSHYSPSHDSGSEASDSGRCSERGESMSNDELRIRKSDPVWDPRASIASDILDSELISLSLPGQTSGRRLCDMFGDRIPVHEDYIKAVAQMPSSPEAESVLPKRVPSKPPRRKKKSLRSFAGIDMTKSMNDACSSSAEKHGSSFSRFFARTKSSS